MWWCNKSFLTPLILSINEVGWKDCLQGGREELNVFPLMSNVTRCSYRENFCLIYNPEKGVVNYQQQGEWCSRSKKKLKKKPAACCCVTKMPDNVAFRFQLFLLLPQPFHIPSTGTFHMLFQVDSQTCTLLPAKN